MTPPNPAPSKPRVMALPARSPPTIETLGTAYGEAQRSVEDLTANAAWISVQGTDFPRRRADPPLKKKILARRQKILDNHKHLTYSATFQRWAWDEKSLVAETIDEACRLPTLDRHSDRIPYEVPTVEPRSDQPNSAASQTLPFYYAQPNSI